VAWVGVIAIIGLVLCGLDALRDRIHARRGDGPDDRDRPWWRRRWALLAASGTALALLLVVILVVALGGSSTTPKVVAAPTTTTTAPTTTTTSRGRPPSLVHVEVINASGVPKAAATKAAALTALGYPVVGTANAVVQPGSIVECKPFFDVEATALAAAVGPGTTVQPFPVPAPAGSASADCVAVIGK
jgi:hypothetical protein